MARILNRMDQRIPLNLTNGKKSALLARQAMAIADADLDAIHIQALIKNGMIIVLEDSPAAVDHDAAVISPEPKTAATPPPETGVSEEKTQALPAADIPATAAGYPEETVKKTTIPKKKSTK